MLKSKPKILIAFLAAFIMAGNSGTYAKADTTDTINRIAGADRYDTADAIVEKGWTQSDMVVITSGVDFPDALCAGPLAKKYNAPIFLAAKDGLSDETIDKIKELNATKVIIVGGKGAVSANVEIQLSGIGITSVQRIGGTNRYNTSVLVAEQLNKPSAVVIALGDNYPDVLSISAIASQQGMPIILASKNSLSDEAVNYIKNSGVTKTYIVGGTSVLSSSIENSVPNPIRLSGSNRYETNLAVLNQFTPNLMFNNVYIATGNNFADALAGCELAAKSQSPIILVSNNLTSRMSNYIKRHISINTNVIALGGNNAVNDSIIEEILEMYHPVGLDKVPLAEDSSDKKGYNEGCWLDPEDNIKNELGIGGKDYLNEYYTQKSNRSNLLCSLLNNVDKASYSINLNGKYSRLTAIAGIDDNSTQKENAKMKLEIIADGYSLFEKELKWGDAPVNIDINLKNYKKLIIEINNTGGSTFLLPDQLDILGMKFYIN